MRVFLPVACSAALLTAVPAIAQDIAIPGGSIVLDEIVVSASPSDGEATDSDIAYQSLSPTSARTREELAATGQTGSVSEILQSMPGVIAPSSADDPATSVNIRGLQDFGRVNVMIDGARQNFQRSGHASDGSFYFDQEMMKAVEVERGPGATVGGSGAIGGVVQITTIDADDVLRDDENIGGRIKVEGQGNGLGAMAHVEAATRISEAFDILAAGTFRQVDDYTTGGGEKVNSAQTMVSGLLKARVRVAEGHETTLSAMRLYDTFDNGISTVRTTTSIDDTFTVAHHWDPADNDLINLNARAYYTGTTLDQEDQNGWSVGAKRTFEIGTYGTDAVNVARFDAFGFDHTTRVGGELFYDHVQTRDENDLANNSTPPGERTVYAAFVEHTLERGWFEVVGGLRLDGYHLTGEDRVNDVDVEKNGSRISPKITVGVTPIEPLTIYVGYSEGYRSPSLTETLVQGFHPPPATFAFLPNPNLVPETAHNLEGGVTLRFDDVVRANDRLRLKGSVFQNRVDDYIELECSPFPLPGACTYDNIAEAKIEGIELEGTYDAGRVFAGLTATFLRSEDLREGDTLASVPPSRLSATLGFRAFHDRLDAGGRVTFVGAKEDAEDAGLVGDAYQLVDLFANWRIDDNTSASLTLNNIFDVDYTQYLNLEASPGFNAKFAFVRRFGANTQ
ncbi:TonB-dependent receptor domain-containing protein [Acuticoccus kandeliae]|uniref:TonB-dependent receptor domain-containing protein n=1 Tax=Acuticoccus kandeliae TaxID=2073160 RepID=UPI000D3E59ED|nr:TonB-dependent receptor [Acuticoccus kandeliae]